MHRQPSVGDVISLPPHNTEWIVCATDSSSNIYLLDDITSRKKTITTTSTTSGIEYFKLSTLSLIDIFKRSVIAKLIRTHYSS